MEKVLNACLSQLGCNEKHVRFYKATLNLGAASLTEITKKARLQRSTAYVLAAEMVEMGLINEDHKPYKKTFMAVEPDVLLQKLEARRRQITRRTIAFREALPEIRATYQVTETRPRVRTFEGKSGLVAVWQDILSEQQEILLWTNQWSERRVFGENTHDQFIKERIKKNISIRVLAVKNKDGEALLANDTTSKRHTKLLPGGVEFTGETYIYGNKVAILDIGKNIFGIITENEQIATSQRAFFELTWQQTEDNSEKLIIS